MPTLNTIEMDGSELKKQSLAPGASTLDIVIDWVSGMKNEDEETRTKPQVDEYPDGGLAAWCIVLGVGPFISSSLEFY